MAARLGQKTMKTTMNLTKPTIDRLDAIANNTGLRSRSTVVEEMLGEVLEVKDILAKAEHDLKAINFKDQSNTWAAVLNMSLAVGDASRRLSRFDDKSTKRAEE